ncbi:MAG: molybdopterin cofactor-binding domain-containing protein [Myxococcota bacterium]|nr:molybdopterin cofactor-binding domain-containing protein [Myxococcota bacterium]
MNHNNQFKGGVVGKGGPKTDGAAKITGQAKFTDDLSPPNCVYTWFLRSPHAHAWIRRIDTKPALQMPGVFAVLTGSDLPTRYCAIPLIEDETALALEKVRYVGEPVACVAAKTEDIARQATQLIHIEYELLPAILSISDAQNPDLPFIHHEAKRPSNTLRRVKQKFGDPDAAFQNADVVFEANYSYPGSTHVPLEPHACLAKPESNGRLTVWSSTQNPHYLHRTLAQVLGIETHDIRLIKPDVGAGYGGKCDAFSTDICAAYLAKKLNRPVKAQFTREGVFYAHRGRHPVKMRLKMAAMSDGTITAAELEAIADGGAYASYGVVTSYYLAVFLGMPYAIPNLKTEAHRLYTNKPPCGPKRGHGALQPRFAIEMHIDALAERLNMDPVDLRLKNLMAPYSQTANGLKVYSMGLRECIQAVMDASEYKQKRNNLPPNRGIGLAVSTYMCGALHPVYPNDLPHSSVQIKVDRSGRITIFTGTSDIGQGSNQMLVTVCAERLGIPPQLCTVIEADSDLCPVDLGSYSSRVTFMAGNAMLDAADKIRHQINTVMAEKWGCSESDITATNGIYRTENHEATWTEVIWATESQVGALGSTGSFTPDTDSARARRMPIGPSPAYSFTAQVAELTVDPDTGFITIHDIWCAHDLGRTLHPDIADGQIEGCVYMGVGEALFEEQAYQGPIMMTPSILEYKIPTVGDTPRIHAIRIESHDPNGPLGAKEVGEGPQLSTVPAIANAITHATGLRLTAPPYTPDHVFRALRIHRRKTETE